jgi:hypothetical protein
VPPKPLATSEDVQQSKEELVALLNSFKEIVTNVNEK